MINNLRMRDFKCFDDFELPMGRLNLLTGLNAAGKSTSLQVMLLLAQFFRGGAPMIDLPLDGEYVTMGKVGDVVNRNALSHGINSITLGAEFDGVVYDFVFDMMKSPVGHAFICNEFFVKGFGFEMTRPSVVFSTDGIKSKAVKSEFVKFENRFNVFRFAIADLIYLSAARIAGEQIFTMPNCRVESPGRVGRQGEFAPCLLHIYSDDSVHPSRRHKSEKSDSLRRQVNAWLSEIFPGSQVNVVRLDGTHTYKLELKTSESGQWLHPANVGYGISYALPMIVAGLLAVDGQILIVDSPEAHLHPAAQSAIGKFFSMIANSGVQVVLETHSDHVLNGVRISVKDGVISPEDLKIHFFGGGGYEGGDFEVDGYEKISRFSEGKNGSERQVGNKVRTLHVNRGGQINNWPSGFFDQAEIDLSNLSGW